MENLDSKSLLLRLKEGDMSAFDEIYLNTKKNIFYTIYFIIKDQMASEDLMQEVYIDFLGYHSTLPKNTEIAAWLNTSAKNKAINYYNRNKKEEEFSNMLEDYSYANDRILDTGLLKIVKETLDAEEFEVFTLHVLGEYTFKEISQTLGIPMGTLTWMYQECRKKLMDVLGGNFND